MFQHLTTSYIRKSLNDIDNKIDKQETNLLKDKKNQDLNEKILLRKIYNVSTSNNRDTFVNEFNNLNIEKLQDLVHHDFYNSQVMENISQLVSTLVYFDETPRNNNTHIINRYITNLKRIGEPSENGIAMKADFKNAKDLFIVKAPKDPVYDELKHELIVSIFGTNQMRKYIPNFAYVYGGFKCSPPILNVDDINVVNHLKGSSRDVNKWCVTNNNEVNYILYENIAPADTASNFFKDCSQFEFLDVFMQVLYSIKMANHLIDFTHYDLHTNNVLIRKPFDKEFQIDYADFTKEGQIPINGKYLKTNFIATIIDYGMSHIAIRDTHYGFFGFEKLFILQERSNIMYDLYKFLMFAASDTIKYNKPVFEIIRIIFEFFNIDEKLEDALINQEKNYYCYPLTEDTNLVTIEAFEEYLEDNFDMDSFISERMYNNVDILDCEKMCLTKNQIIKELTK